MKRSVEPQPPRDSGNGIVRHARRVIIGVIGSTVVGIGVAMIVLPGPAFLVIPLGLSILAAEFAWAGRVLHRLKEQGKRVFDFGRK